MSTFLAQNVTLPNAIDQNSHNEKVDKDQVNSEEAKAADGKDCNDDCNSVKTGPEHAFQCSF